MIIAVDGPAGAGKSTIAKTLAKKLGIAFLDTGAMYRALTLKAMNVGVDLEDVSALVALAKQTSVILKQCDEGCRVFLDGQDVSEEIRTQEVTDHTHFIARATEVRRIIVGWQQTFGQNNSLVGEGRDIGTVVFPSADFKFYLDADIHVRFERRLKEYQKKGEMVNEERLLESMKIRDKRDQERAASPLKQADDAIYIDSTHMSVDECVDYLMKLIKTPSVISELKKDK